MQHACGAVWLVGRVLLSSFMYMCGGGDIVSRVARIPNALVIGTNPIGPAPESKQTEDWYSENRLRYANSEHIHQ